jgi:hypothetical protein
VIVYVAGPYSSGDLEENIDLAVFAAESLVSMGHVPFVPHLMYSAWEERVSRDYEFYMTQCLGILSRCEALLRIPGISPGADREVARALELEIPVFFEVGTLAEAHSHEEVAESGLSAG